VVDGLTGTGADPAGTGGSSFEEDFLNSDGCTACCYFTNGTVYYATFERKEFALYVNDSDCAAALVAYTPHVHTVLLVAPRGLNRAPDSVLQVIGTFTSLRSLNMVDFSNWDDIMRLAVELRDHLTTLRLRLSQEVEFDFARSHLDRLTNLQVLALLRARLTSLPDNAFTQLTQLVNLD